MKTPLALIFALLLTCAGTGAALAKTPDEPLSFHDTVCHGETGAALGLCLAYCDALDCDNAHPHAPAKACTKLRTLFEKITGHDLPCEQPTCVCQSIPQFAAGLTTATSCTIDSDQGLLFSLPGNDAVAIFAGSSNDPQCGYSNNATGDVFTLPVTPAEITSCTQVMQAAAASLGLTCQ